MSFLLPKIAAFPVSRLTQKPCKSSITRRSNWASEISKKLKCDKRSHQFDIELDVVLESIVNVVTATEASDESLRLVVWMLKRKRNDLDMKIKNAQSSRRTTNFHSFFETSFALQLNDQMMNGKYHAPNMRYACPWTAGITLLVGQQNEWNSDESLSTKYTAISTESSKLEALSVSFNRIRSSSNKRKRLNYKWFCLSLIDNLRISAQCREIPPNSEVLRQNSAEQRCIAWANHARVFAELHQKIIIQFDIAPIPEITLRSPVPCLGMPSEKKRKNISYLLPNGWCFHFCLWKSLQKS